MVKYILKVGKDNLDVEHDQNDSFQQFQAKVFTLTDIPPKNLKILCKSKMIKDNASLFALPAESVLIVMGTKAGKQLKMTADLKVDTKMQVQQPGKIPQRYGLANVGNTCYMNAAIQLLRSIPELNKQLRNMPNPQGQNVEKTLTKLLGSVFNQLENKDYTPQMFVAMFLQSHEAYLPLGTQHDSDEFMQELLNIIQRASPQLDKIIKSLFAIEFAETLKNTQIQEQPKYDISTSNKLCCNVGGVEKESKIANLNEGIKLNLEGTLEKISQVDNQNHLYLKQVRFNNLPPYLIVQMVRFFWKKADDLPHSKPTAAKVCRSIVFSHKIDIFDHCTEQLKGKLEKGRLALEQNKKQEQAEYKKQYEQYKELLKQSNRPQKRVMEEFKEKWKRQQKPVTEGLQTGFYELVGTVTHLGHSVDSGHYMAWIKENEEDWTKYDDNTVYQQPSEKVLHLRGGQPNLQIAYVLLFKKVYARPL